jgi:hypothetical protein
MPNEIILVAGVDYPKYKPADRHKMTWKLARAVPGQSKTWRTFCERWAAKAAKAAKDPGNLHVTLFDFTKGTRETLIIDRAGRASAKTEEVQGALTPGNYRRVDDSDANNMKLVPIQPNEVLTWPEEPRVFYFPGITQKFGAGTVTVAAYRDAYVRSQLAEKSISITHVYAYICSLGNDKNKLHTLTELHFFTHGTFEGPILVNSLDLHRRLLNDKGPQRDPLDKDARSQKDFELDNLGMDCFQKFPAAFASQARGFVWGCDFTKFWKKVIQETLRRKVNTRSLDSLLSPFTYTDEHSWGMNEEDFHSILGSGARPHQSKRLTVREVRELLRDLIEDAYMQKLATASRHITVGALPGTYADFDTTGKREDRFLHIPLGAATGNGGDDSTDKPVNFSSILKFYKDVVGREFDVEHGFSPPFGRGYGIFRP